MVARMMSWFRRLERAWMSSWVRITLSGEKIIIQTSDKTRPVTRQVISTISTLTKVLVGVAEGVAALATTKTQEEIVSIDILMAGSNSSNMVQRRMTLKMMTMMSRNSAPDSIRIHMVGVVAAEEVVEVAITIITAHQLTTLHRTTRMAGMSSKWMHMAIMWKAGASSWAT